MFKGKIPRLPLLSPCKIASDKWAPLIQRSLGTCVDWNSRVWLPSSAVSGHFAMLLQYVDFLPNAGCLLTFWFPEFYYKNALFFTTFPPLFPPSLYPSQTSLIPYPPTSSHIPKPLPLSYPTLSCFSILFCKYSTIVNTYFSMFSTLVMHDIL